MSGIGTLWTVGAFIVAIAVLVVIHELGHFVAARWCGVKVLRFSVGFGKPLGEWRLGRDMTTWSIAAIPLGGYVKMLDEREGLVAPEEAGRAFNRQPVVRRMLIVAAGPVANLLLALLLFWVMFMHGIQDLKPVLGTPPPDSIAAAAGITSGERIISVDGKPLATWSELRMEVLNGVLDRHSPTLETINSGGQIAYRRLDVDRLTVTEMGDDPTHAMGLRIYRPPVKPFIGLVIDGSPAQQAGLRPGDFVLSIDGKPVRYWEDVVALIQAASGHALVMELLRDSKHLTAQLTPQQVLESGHPVGRIGIAVQQDPKISEAMLTLVRYSPVDALMKASSESWNTARLSLVMMGRMVIGEVSWRNISGPVTIADYAGQSARLGISSYLRFLALISISIGILNLLPIPVLDGGHLMYYLVESIKGSPVPERVQEIGQTIGFGVLGLLMAFALFNDIHRLISG